jgi:hypothetical protein
VAAITLAACYGPPAVCTDSHTCGCDSPDGGGFISCDYDAGNPDVGNPDAGAPDAGPDAGP